jgi:hypothetical protein
MFIYEVERFMARDVISMLPQHMTGTLMLICIMAIAGGIIFWLAGAVWSRYIVTLIFVALGGAAGMWLPRWYIWPVNSMSTAVLGAVIFGVLAYVVPRLFVGLLLGFVLVAWATLGTWMLMRGDEPFPVRPEWQTETMTPPEHARDIFQRLPEQVRRVVPYSAATAMISGLCITLLWPRVGRLLMATTMGVTLLFLASLTLISLKQPDWIRYIPPETEAQIGVLLALVVLGTLVQWQILPTRKETAVLDQQQSSPV